MKESLILTKKKSAGTGIGVVCFITNPDRTRFLIQRKDGSYPYAKQHRTVCLFGGHVEASETPLAAILRELEEEVCYQPILDLAKANLAYSILKLSLPSQNNPGTNFVLCAYELTVPDDVFSGLEKVLYSPGIICEGYGEIVTRDYLKFLVDFHPDDFFSTLSKAFDIYLSIDHKIYEVLSHTP